jgi:Asp-tRNA(Asn)/Glu-tRNA(Gln) amidotransferase A subunit family amidase
VCEAAALVASLGHHVEDARPSFDAQELKDDMFNVVGCTTAQALATRAIALDRPPIPADVECDTWLRVQRCRQRCRQEMAKAIGTIHTVARHVGRCFEQHVILLTPTSATPPLPRRQVDMRSGDHDDHYDRLCNDTFPTLCNCTGVPAVSVPLGRADGLPSGIQLAAPLACEMRLLQGSVQLEYARPWADRRPGRCTDTPSAACRISPLG